MSNSGQPPLNLPSNPIITPTLVISASDEIKLRRRCSSDYGEPQPHLCSPSTWV
ncbi:uncharacterized protein RSE6_02159 [Rhynchosporium secalis]|uniref:Uncharacterized protein n=1 Tax=Rhynchosporium secalis TaxID=38038 RepID=A0A1E1LZK8_RHYSE|nr:uncharacterized protein RSE6_02159 [Rhynchosporium secalis]